MNELQIIDNSIAIKETIGLNNPIGVYIPKGCKMIESFAGINMSGNLLSIENFQHIFKQIRIGIGNPL